MQTKWGEWQKKYPFQIVIVSSDSREEMEKFLKYKGIDGAMVLIDRNGQAFNKYKVQAIPADFLINEKGELESSFIGWRGSNSINQLEKWLQGQQK